MKPVVTTGDGFSKSGLYCLKRYLERQEEDGWLLRCIFCMSLRWWGRELSSISFLATEGMNCFTGKVLRLFSLGVCVRVWNKDSVCNLMPSGGSWLAFRAIRFIPVCNRSEVSMERQCQNTHRNHFKEAWIMLEALRSCYGLTVLTCHRGSVHGIIGGLVLCVLLCGMEFCFQGCRRMWRLKADLLLWLGPHSTSSI